LEQRTDYLQKRLQHPGRKLQEQSQHLDHLDIRLRRAISPAKCSSSSADAIACRSLLVKILVTLLVSASQAVARYREADDTGCEPTART